MLETLANLDRVVFCAINAGWSHPVLDPIFALFSLLGEGGPLTLFGLLLLYFYDRKNFPKNFLVLTVILLLGSGLLQIVKSMVQRPRPLKDPMLGTMIADGVKSQVLGVWNKLDVPLSHYAEKLHVIGPLLKQRSFPSGHSFSAFGFATALVLTYRRPTMWLWYLPAILVALSRIYNGVHFPVDVATGAVSGTIWTMLAILTTRRYTGMGYRRPKNVVPSSSPSGQPLVMIVAGEASADTYAANLIRAMKIQSPNARFVGIGGERAKAAGMEMLGDAADLSIVGFTAVVVGIGKIQRLYRRALKAMEEQKPDVLVCIDLPDFNLMLANQAKARGIAVLYYISPQIWAWRTGRVLTIADRIDHIVVALPFEKKFYEEHGVAVSYAGHPILETIAPKYATREQARQAFGLALNKRVVVLAPGSRGNEIKYLAEMLAEGAKLAAAENADLQFAVPLAPTIEKEHIEAIFGSTGLDVVYTRGDFYDLLACADAGAITSGTATLEAALAGLPHIIAYRGHSLNVMLARKLVKVDKIGLPNIILERVAFPELIQDDCSPQALADWIGKMLAEPARQDMLAACAQVRERLDGGDVSGHVAARILELIERRRVKTA